MLNLCDFIQVYVFTTNHHLKESHLPGAVSKELCDVFRLFQKPSGIVPLYCITSVKNK